MASSKLILSAVVCLFVSSGSFAQDDDLFTEDPIDAISEVTTDASLVLEVSPPNCVCPAIPVTTTTPLPTPPSSTLFPWFPPRPRPSRPSRRPLCGSDGQNYTTVCDFVNAQGNDENLGLVLCAGQTIPNIPNFKRPRPFNGNRPGQFSSYRPQRPFPVSFPGFENCAATGSAYRRREPRVCMTDDTTLTIRQAARSLRTSTSVGIRCTGCCPCTLRCPPAFIAGYPAIFSSGRS